MTRTGPSAGASRCDRGQVDAVPGFETIEARRDLDLAYHTWNGDPEEHDPGDVGGHRSQAGWALGHFLGAILKKAAGPGPVVDPKAQHEDELASAREELASAERDAASAAEIVAQFEADRVEAGMRVERLRRRLSELERGSEKR
jgi:hypothetical protein